MISTGIVIILLMAVAFVGTVSGFVGATMGYRRNGAAAMLTNAASGLVEGLQKEMCRLRDRVTALEQLSEQQARVIEDLWRELKKATTRIEALEEEKGDLERENAKLRYRLGGARPA